MRYSLLSFLVLLYPILSSAQHSTEFDYEVTSVKMYTLDETTGKKEYVHDLGAYLYDIGPNPHFHFEVEINQITFPSPLASRANLIVERYALLESKSDAPSFSDIDSTYSDLIATEPTWVFSGPVEMTFNRVRNGNKVILTSPPAPLDFLDPENPLTYASPYGYILHGFAYRFTLLPRLAHHRDVNPANNAIQLTFIKH